MKLIYLKSAFKCDSFDVTIGIKIPFFIVSVTIEPGLFDQMNCLIITSSSSTLLFRDLVLHRKLLGHHVFAVNTPGFR